MAVTSVTDHPDSGAGTKTTDERTYVRKQPTVATMGRMAALTVVLANACHALAQHSDFGVVRKGLLPFAYITRRKVWRLCK